MVNYVNQSSVSQCVLSLGEEETCICICAYIINY